MFNFFTESDNAEESTASIAGMLPTVPLTASAKMPYIDSDIDEDKRIDDASIIDINDLFSSSPGEDLDDNGVPIIRKLSPTEEDGTDKDGDDSIHASDASNASEFGLKDNTTRPGVAEEGVKDVVDKVVNTTGSIAKKINTRALKVKRWELERRINSLKAKIANASSEVNKAKFKTKLSNLKDELAELDKSIKALTESVAYYEADDDPNSKDETKDDTTNNEGNEDEEKPAEDNTNADSDQEGNKKKFDTPNSDDVVNRMKEKGRIKPDGTLSSQSDDALKEKGKSVYDKSDTDAMTVAKHQAQSTMKTADELKANLKKDENETESEAMKTVYKTLIAKIDKKQEDNIKKAVDKMDDLVDNAINVADNDLPDDLNQRQAVDNNAPEPEPEAPEAQPAPDKDVNDQDDSTTDSSDQNAGNTNPEEGQTVNADGTTSQESVGYHFFNTIDNLFTEAPDEVADEIAPIIDKLNKKGYKTKYSSPGYKTEFKHFKGDIDKNGTYNGKLYSSARIQFDGDYKFPSAPKGWEWKSVDKNDYLQVKGKHTTDPDDNGFQSWKKDYMKSLTDWVKDLPDRKGAERDGSNDIPNSGPDPTPEPKTESVNLDTMIDDMMSTMVNESMFGVMDIDTYSSYFTEDADDPDYPIDAPSEKDDLMNIDAITKPKMTSLVDDDINDVMKELISSSIGSMTPEHIENENKQILTNTALSSARKACDSVNDFIASIQTSPRVKQVSLLEDRAGLASYIANATFKCNDVTLDQKTYNVPVPCKAIQAIDSSILNEYLTGYANNLALSVGNLISSQDVANGTLDRYAREISSALSNRGKMKSLSNEPVPYSHIIEWYVPTAIAINDGDPLYTISTALHKLVNAINNSESITGAYNVVLNEIQRTLPTVYKAYNTLYSDRESILKSIVND